MDLFLAKRKANQMLRDFGLAELGWTHEWDRAKRRFGSCNYTLRVITQSKELVRLNDEEAVEQNMLHEIAHALAGPYAKHGPEWKRIARRIGHSGDRCFSATKVTTPPAPYKLICDNCGASQNRHRRSKNEGRSACGKCCKKYNGGKWTSKYLLRLVRNV